MPIQDPGGVDAYQETIDNAGMIAGHDKSAFARKILDPVDFPDKGEIKQKNKNLTSRYAIEKLSFSAMINTDTPDLTTGRSLS